MTSALKNLPDLWICGDAYVERFSPVEHPDPGEALWHWQPEDQDTLCAG